MKKISMLAISCLCLLIAIPSFADIYEWIDEKGNTHVVDDILNVPPKYKDKVKVYKQKPAETKPRLPAEKNIEQPAIPADKEELFGDYPLEWWKREFEKRKKDISDMEKVISEQKKYIAVFQKGRRSGQIYTKEEIELYEDYKKQLPSNEKKLEELKKELDELKGKATIYGVPRDVRE